MAPKVACLRLLAAALLGLPLASQAQAPRAAAPAPAKGLPVYVSGDRITGQSDIEATIEGHAELQRGDTTIRADRMTYDVPADRARAEGNVSVLREGNLYQGTLLDLQVDAYSGFFTDVNYRLHETQAHGESSRVDFIDRDRSVVHQGTYTTCQRDEDDAHWRPDWILRADALHLDQAEDVGRAEGGVLEFKGVPILPLPGISFPLSDRRKSGLLPPTIGMDSLSGLQYTQPYYWNIAPNRDATIAPTLMARRGVALDGSFRYLEPSYSGELSASFMPNDKLRERDRWSLGIKHDDLFASPVGDLRLAVNLRRVSDDNYWRDFPLRGESYYTDTTAQRLLPGDARLSWARGDHAVSVRTLKWQTLQDVSAPITPPYDMAPQLDWQWRPQEIGGGLDMSVQTNYTHFIADRDYIHQPNTQRSFMVAQVSRPFLAPAGFITPRLQLHATHYSFDTPLTGGQRSASRTLPTFSLDSGLVFERDTRLLGRSLTQTLEPRAFYTYTPYRDQSMLPVYDTALQDFNFASIYTENSFSGNDRIADNNLLTLGVTSRLLDADTGAEAARFAIAQRLRNSDQRVAMPGALAARERVSDVLLGAGLNWTPQWGMDAFVQYNPKTRKSERSTLAARYTPSKYRTVSAAYRMNKISDLITEPNEQLDVAWQWPIGDLWGDRRSGPTREAGRWFSVGRLNYSLLEHKLVDTVVGLEYESCCWIGRVVLERLQRADQASNTRILVQLEFSGFSRLSLGSNPLDSLRQHIPNYQTLGADRPAP